MSIIRKVMGKNAVLDKNGFLSTWGKETYKDYYSKNREARRKAENSYFKKVKKNSK